ncbi:hypothetical protein LA76x_1239 [Lysobacter antibioticus]|uniref:Uncharacterized protein n=1 Tax=Lysobacter antibioticus TaxID=84531 RepID=A0A0S2F779_LYSAN|nr:hypothetical protein LA76x_1239 [Lysobacter antibioticus]
MAGQLRRRARSRAAAGDEARCHPLTGIPRLSAAQPSSAQAVSTRCRCIVTVRLHREAL